MTSIEIRDIPLRLTTKNGPIYAHGPASALMRLLMRGVTGERNEQLTELLAVGGPGGG